MALPATATQQNNRLSAGGGRQVFDVVVFGGQFAGLIAAGLLLKRGYRVLVLDADSAQRGYEVNGFRLPWAPFVMPPLKSVPALEAAFTELGLLQIVQRNAEPFAPDLQLLLPKHRLDLSSQPHARASELRREFPEIADAQLRDLRFASGQREKTDGFFASEESLPPDGFFQRWFLKRRISKVPALADFPPFTGTDPVSVSLRRLAPFLHHGAIPGAPLPEARTLSQHVDALLRYPNGREGLAEALAKRVEELGAVVLSSPPGKPLIESLLFDGRRLTGAQLARGDVVSATCGLVAMDAAGLARFVPEKRAQNRLLRTLREARHGELLFPVNLVVPASAVPVGMGQLAVLEPRGNETGPVLLQVLPAPSSPEHRVVTAATFVPGDALERGSAFLEQCRDKLLAALADVLPFAAEQTLLVSAPLLDVGRPAAHGHLALEDDAVLGVCGLPPRSPAPNLLFCSREVLPGLGLEGEALAAYRSFRLIQRLIKKRDPLKG